MRPRIKWELCVVLNWSVTSQDRALLILSCCPHTLLNHMFFMYIEIDRELLLGLCLNGLMYLRYHQGEESCYKLSPSLSAKGFCILAYQMSQLFSRDSEFGYLGKLTLVVLWKIKVHKDCREDEMWEHLSFMLSKLHVASCPTQGYQQVLLQKEMCTIKKQDYDTGK